MNSPSHGIFSFQTSISNHEVEGVRKEKERLAAAEIKTQPQFNHYMNLLTEDNKPPGTRMIGTQQLEEDSMGRRVHP